MLTTEYPLVPVDSCRNSNSESSSGDIKRMETEGLCAKLRKVGMEDATLGQIKGSLSEFPCYTTARIDRISVK